VEGEIWDKLKLFFKGGGERIGVRGRHVIPLFVRGGNVNEMDHRVALF
jgi:hypothetical protein